MKKTLYTSIFLLLLSSFAFAQKKVKQDKQRAQLSVESIQNVCKDLPHDQRLLVTVQRFNITSPTKPDAQFGDNLATMLETALMGTHCFTVLSRLKDNADNTAEIDFDNSGNTPGHTLQRGQMKVANAIVIGEVTKFEESTNTGSFTVIKSSTSKASIGITIKLQNPETREIYVEKTFNAVKKVNSGTSVGTRLPIFGRIDLASGSMKNPAVQSAAEEAIYAAVEFIATEKEKLHIAANQASRLSSIVVENIEYVKLSSLVAAIEKIPGVQSVNSDNFVNNKATILIGHSGKSRELVDQILALNTGITLAVNSLSREGATLNVK
jgi:curli biogenesis system outer membrane secretion channel CsgG